MWGDYGGVIVAGSIPSGPGATDIFLRAYQPDGQLDTTFASGGTARINIGQLDRVSDLYSDGGRNIIVVGETQRSGGNRELAFLRLTSSGRLDRRFGNGGVLVSPALSDTGQLVFTWFDGPRV